MTDKINPDNILSTKQVRKKEKKREKWSDLITTESGTQEKNACKLFSFNCFIKKHHLIFFAFNFISEACFYPLLRFN